MQLKFSENDIYAAIFALQYLLCNDCAASVALRCTSTAQNQIATTHAGAYPRPFGMLSADTIFNKTI